MKACDRCRDAEGKPIHGYYSLKDRLLRRAGGCNWLDWMVPDDRCPHCGGPLRWFRPTTAFGAALDGLGSFREAAEDR